MTDPTFVGIKTGYPPEIQHQLKGLTQLITGSLDPIAIYLLGSAARGELSWMRHPTGEIELFSDYELAVITQNRPKKALRRELEQHVRAFEQQISNSNPLFHIDILLREQHRIASMPRIIFTFEFKHNGVLLYGKDIRDNIPDITPENLNYRNTHEILYKRLWALLLHIPEVVLHNKLKADTLRVAGYSLCRNALDLTTVFLPHEGYLLPTYNERVNTLIENSPKFAKYFGHEFPAFMQFCLDRRRDLHFSQNTILPLYTKTIDYLEQGLLYFMHDPNIHTLPHYSPQMFNEHPISRGEWYNLLRLTYHNARYHGLHKTINWLRQPKKGWLALGLLMMHKSLISWMNHNSEDAENHLADAIKALETITVMPNPTQEQSFPNRWMALRRLWGRAWLQMIRLGTKTAEERITTVLDWKYE